MKVNKMYLDWQIKRVSLKKYKSSLEKCKEVYDFLLDNLSINNKERVLNYLNGLKLAYKKVTNDPINVSIINDHIVKVNKLYTEVEELPESDIKNFSKEELIDLSKDLINRTKRWVTKGYFHNEQNDFILQILNHLGDKNEIKSFKKLLDDNKNKKNTHKFIY